MDAKFAVRSAAIKWGDPSGYRLCWMYQNRNEESRITPNRVITDIVFDVGKVLVDYDPNWIISQVLKSTEQFSEADGDLMIEHLFYAPIWQEMDAGRCEDEAVSELCAALGNRYRPLIERCLIDYVNYLSVIEPVKTVFRQLTQKYPVYLLSNFQDRPFDRLVSRYPFLQLATGWTVSGKVKQMKPDPSIYQTLMSTYGLIPETTIFIDDLSENIATAIQLGMHGIVFESPNQLTNALHRAGISWT